MVYKPDDFRLGSPFPYTLTNINNMSSNTQDNFNADRYGTNPLQTNEDGKFPLLHNIRNFFSLYIFCVIGSPYLGQDTGKCFFCR